MSKIAVATKRFSGFMKRNAMYLLILLCIASVATVIALAATGNFGEQSIDIDGEQNNNDTDIPTVGDPDDKPSDQPIVKPDPPVDDTPVDTPLTFTAPCVGTVTVSYSDTVLVWNSTLGQYSTHLAVDFVAEDLRVLAVAGGTVKEVGYDALNGNYVIITHKDGYESRYFSLGDGVTLKAGDTVAEGDVIGTMSTTMAKESLDGNHLHFEMSKDGVDIDPLSVIILNEK